MHVSDAIHNADQLGNGLIVNNKMSLCSVRDVQTNDLEDLSDVPLPALRCSYRPCRILVREDSRDQISSHSA